jgi:hypothetical protein
MLALFLLAVPAAVSCEEKVILGEVEDVILLPWHVKLPARIDTGAVTSSLVARDLSVKDSFAEFKLPQKYGNLKLRLPIAEWQRIRSNEGLERRPVVEVELCLGPKRLRTKVTLDDRKGMRYPLLVGRNTLKENFIVDCARSNCFPPVCSEASSK